MALATSNRLTRPLELQGSVGLVAPTILALLLLAVSPLHHTFREWDGVMQYFAGRELLAGQGYRGWTAQFWPPLYSLLVGVGSTALPGFAAAKLVSGLSAVVLLGIVYYLALELTGSRPAAIFAQVLVLVNPLFFLEALQAQNRMLDALFFVGALYCCLRAIDRPDRGSFFLAGAVAGLAGLSRYTSYTLLLLVIPIFHLLRPWRGTAGAAQFLAAFTLVSLPWWLYNASAHGSPLHSWQYLNIGSSVVPMPGGWKQWYWYGQDGYGSLGEIVLRHPQAYLNNIRSNLINSAWALLRATGALAPLIVPLLAASLFVLPRRHIIIMGALLLAYVSLVSQAFVLTYAYLSWGVLLTTVGALTLAAGVSRLRTAEGPSARLRLAQWACVGLCLGGAGVSAWKTADYLGDPYHGGVLAELFEVADALRAYDPDIDAKRVMAMHPARAYYTGSQYLATPEYYEGSVAGLVAFAGLSDKVKNYAQKYPSDMALSDLGADYLIYTQPQPTPYSTDAPEFAFLLDPTSELIPADFQPVYQSEHVAVYAIRRAP